MGLFKRGKYWVADFWFKKRRYQVSSRITNHEQAKTWLRAFRTNLALTGVGMVQKEPAPILSVFLKGQFLDMVRQGAKKPRTMTFYSQRVKRLCEYPPFTTLRLDQVDEIAVQGYVAFRQRPKQAAATKTTTIHQAPTNSPPLFNVMPRRRMPTAAHLSIATINGELRTLRKALIFASRCKLCDRPRVSTLPGETNRTFVLTGEMELAFLAVANYPLKQVAILMLDLGLRPEECVSLRKADITYDAVTVVGGKTANARRVLPQTERTREVFALCAALYPESEWVFPGSKSGHFTRGAIDNLFTRLRSLSRILPQPPTHTAGVAVVAVPVASTARFFPREFVLYSCRHTFATRLAEACGGDTFLLMKALGHASPVMCSKYIHPSADYLTLALKKKELLDRLMRGEVDATHSLTSPHFKDGNG